MTAASTGPVRVRASAPHPYDGLRGHAYIAARGLSPRIAPHGRAVDAPGCQCAACIRERMLPAVQALCAAQGAR
jgi:hypothetical protein